MDNGRENIYFQLDNQRGGEFPVFQGARYIQYGNGFGDVLRGFLRHLLPVAVKGAATFLGILMQKREEGEIWGNAAKQSILPAAGTVLSEAANRVKQGGSGKKKRKKLRRSTVYKAPSRSKKRKHSNSEADSDFYVEEEPKKLIKYNFYLEGLLSELDYFEPNVTQLCVMGDYDRVFGTGQTRTGWAN